MNKKINKHLIINLGSKIKDAIYKIDKNTLRTLIVIKEKKVVGVLSEGDLMRAFINGFHLQNEIDEIVQYNFKYLKIDNIHQVPKIIKKELILLIPIVNEEMELIDVKTIKDVI